MISNKIKYKIIITTAIIFSLSSCTKDDKQTVVTKNTLVMSDEFNVNGAPNPNLWSYNIGSGNNGWGNNELQYYTSRAQNIIVENGVLKITARREQYMGKAFTSARIVTKGKFETKYGRIEARIKLPRGKGLWPAFWMLGSNSDTAIWPQCGEIDIMEYLGNSPTKVFGTVHGPGYSGGNAITKTYTLPNSRFDTDFHVFGVEWDENYINFYVDEVLYNQITPSEVTGDWVFNNPFYIILNMAVGGNYPGAPNSETPFPQEMLVDYVRVYQ
ncbi:family 16 glycosylhydrolase [Flavobacterium sp.]|jgi:beta-glucanase (GH16 family)|uniref:glycoside hydrolase family 16 protein n=1 Tax=Flavobacterium sp. TaxID=239 RepID=UPI0037BE704D